MPQVTQGVRVRLTRAYVTRMSRVRVAPPHVFGEGLGQPGVARTAGSGAEMGADDGGNGIHCGGKGQDVGIAPHQRYPLLVQDIGDAGENVARFFHRGCIADEAALGRVISLSSLVNSLANDIGGRLNQDDEIGLWRSLEEIGEAIAVVVVGQECTVVKDLAHTLLKYRYAVDWQRSCRNPADIEPVVEQAEKPGVAGLYKASYPPHRRKGLPRPADAIERAMQYLVGSQGWAMAVDEAIRSPDNVVARLTQSPCNPDRQRRFAGTRDPHELDAHDIRPLPRPSGRFGRGVSWRMRIARRTGQHATLQAQIDMDGISLGPPPREPR
jgi:hypothetical protein